MTRNYLTTTNRESRGSNSGIFAPELPDPRISNSTFFRPEGLQPPTEGGTPLPATAHLAAVRSCKRGRFTAGGAGRKRVAQKELRSGRAFCDRA